MKHKAILFDIDDTLYDSTRQSTLARKNAIEAMIEAGLDVNKKKAEETLAKVIREYGSNYSNHFNKLLKKLGKKPNQRIIAAGIVAYHNTKFTYLHPFEDTLPTLLKLRDMGYKLGVITDGKSMKQWEKLIRLGLQHFFDTVVISEEVGVEKPEKKIFAVACNKLALKPQNCVYVGNHLGKDIAGANNAGMTSVRIMKGKHSETKPKTKTEIPNFEITKLGDLTKLIKNGKI